MLDAARKLKGLIPESLAVSSKRVLESSPYETAHSRILKVFASESIRAVQPFGRTNCGAMCPRPMS